MIDWMLLAQRGANVPAAGIGLGMICIFLFIMLFSIVWIYALIDAIRNPTLTDIQRRMRVPPIINLLIGRRGEREVELAEVALGPSAMSSRFFPSPIHDPTAEMRWLGQWFSVTVCAAGSGSYFVGVRLAPLICAWRIKKADP